MIEESYVSFETAKLLKEKGFKGQCVAAYNGNGKLYGFDEEVDDNTPYWSDAPTLQMAIKWLEETHHVLVVPDYVYECTDTSWEYKIYRLGENGKPETCVVKGVKFDNDKGEYVRCIAGYRDYDVSYKDYATREEAEDEGIRYVLEKYV